MHFDLCPRDHFPPGPRKGTLDCFPSQSYGESLILGCSQVYYLSALNTYTELALYRTFEISLK